MSGTDGKGVDQKSRGDAYEATVLEFLDNEMSATSKTKEGPRARHDDVDVLVNSLLEESIVASDAMEIGREAGFEDLDRLFSSIFKENKEELPVALKTVPLEVDSKPGEIPPEVGLDEVQSVNLHPVACVSCQETMETLPCETVVQAPIAAVEAAPVNPPILPALEESEAWHLEAQAVTPPPPEETGRTLVFSLPPHKPAWNLQLALIGGAFLCLLAGIGFVYYSGSGNAGDPPASTALMPLATPGGATAPKSSPEPAREIKDGAVRPDDGRANRTAAAASIPGNSAANPTVRNPTVHNDGKPVVNVSAPPPNPSTAASAPAAAPTPASLVEKPAASVVLPSENTLPNPPARATDIASPPPVTQAQTTAEPPPAVPAPKTMTTAENTPPAPRAATSSSVASPPSLPKKVTPAVAVSRVLPIYPELARRSRTTGTVVVEIQIDEKGKVVKATPVSGPYLLHSEAVNAVLRWQFKPASLDGVPVSSSSQVSIVFK